MNIKRQMYEEDEGEIMSEEREKMEEIRFKLIDKDRSGTITWTEFVEFEAADLLAKKNKVCNIFSNHQIIIYIYIWTFFNYLMD